ncbi:MAG: outer membrane beta-barrel protein [Gemmatimonadota bacterium]|nr:outer membrane beta-barrel protein [Gemmatimonadota bacterium]MDH4348748.1 outer membrane beta-barrel protein [Gemmatimonadota bacterium]MDH5283782.1 outer membrane beta-barrel protein [Gemmatimonadota bacterium]
MRTLLLMALILGGAASLEAQERNVHKGFWVGFGLGGGTNLSTGFDGESMGGFGGYLKLGGTPSQKVLLGFESLAWGREDGNTDKTRGNAHFVAQFYPSATSGFFLKGGVGVAFADQSTSSGNTTVSTDKGGFGTGAGLGYELQIGRNIYLVGQADYMLQVFEEENVAGLGDIPGTNSIMLFTLGLTWH